MIEQRKRLLRIVGAILAATAMAGAIAHEAQAQPQARPRPASKSTVDMGTRQTLKRRFTELVDLTMDSAFAVAAGYILYTGSDAARTGRDSCIYVKAGDRAVVEALCAQVGGWLKSGVGYAITGFRRDNDQRGERITLLVRFLAASGPVEHEVSFLLVRGQFLVAAVS